MFGGSNNLRNTGRGEAAADGDVVVGCRHQSQEYGRWEGTWSNRSAGSDHESVAAAESIRMLGRADVAAAEPECTPWYARWPPECPREVLSRSFDGRGLEMAADSGYRPGDVSPPVAPTRSLSLDEICDWFGQLTRRRIDVAAWRTSIVSPPKPAALLVLEDRVVVRYDGRRSVRHQTQQICHEFGHVLCDHLGGRKFRGSPGLSAASLDAAALAAAMQRESLDSESEVQAEAVGTQLALMTREVAGLAPGGWGAAGTRARTLAPLWTALTSVVPEVRLGNLDHVRSPVIAEHRMRIEIEDAVVALAPVLDLPGSANDYTWARALAEALDHRESGAAADSGNPAWPTDESGVLAVAKAWTRLHTRSSR